MVGISRRSRLHLRVLWLPRLNRRPSPSPTHRRPDAPGWGPSTPIAGPWCGQFGGRRLVRWPRVRSGCSGRRGTHLFRLRLPPTLTSPAAKKATVALLGTAPLLFRTNSIERYRLWRADWPLSTSSAALQCTATVSKPSHLWASMTGCTTSFTSCTSNLALSREQLCAQPSPLWPRPTTVAGWTAIERRCHRPILRSGAF
mmetsp:Transcript_53144/g.147387  ORF Transcript_53144/g.147387 Transcript_53144/m.147387 type:complete len:200 (+) Transcript_53144:398-997(+)